MLAIGGGSERRMAAEVPIVRAKQLGIFDALVDRDELAREVASGIVLSERAILRQEEGSDSSGHRRKFVGNEVSEAIETFFQQSQITYGYDWACLMLFRILARDPGYLKIAPEWVLTIIAEEKEMLFAVFGGRMRGELARQDEDEEDDEQDENTEYEAMLVAQFQQKRVSK